MKTSKQQQEKTKIKIIETAINLFILKGFEKTTMREIAREATIGDATIYNYFSTKERIIWGYIELRQIQAIKNINDIADFNNYSLQEKIHIYFETILDGYLPDREFLPIAFKMTHQSFLTHSPDIKAINALFIDQIKLFLIDAIEKQEIPEQPIDTIIPHIILDLYFIVILYWTKDSSDKFNQTTQLIDLILNILMGVLKQGLISKVVDLGSFLFRHHLFTQIDSLFKDNPLNTIRSELGKFVNDK
ncbi:TetR/AcrR family transcriptional regulator [bacterium]|jgi:AcrR family transcriptional regulator|nr:TetR/AcrR family transcriptional regulator [bacterium]